MIVYVKERRINYKECENFKFIFEIGNYLKSLKVDALTCACGDGGRWMEADVRNEYGLVG